MGLLTDDEVADLSIERMIFHVVRPEDQNPIFLAEVKPPQFADFFVDRVKETLRGAAYLFVPGSGMPALLSRAMPGTDGSDEFVKVSREVAERFKTKVGTDKRYAPGVLMLFCLKTGSQRLVAIIKYEHQQVISYSYLRDAEGKPVLDADGNPVPDLKSLMDTFTKDRKAMQKSAVVRFGNEDAEDENAKRHRLVVIDHSSGRYRDASQHFVNFMDIKRAMAPEDMTKRLIKAAVEAIKKHKDEVPAEVAKAPNRYVNAAMARMEGFDHEKPEEFMGAVVQGLVPDAPILNTFSRNLSGCGLATEAFRFEGARPARGEYRRVVTNEGVAIIFSQRLEDDGKVKVANEDGGGVVITVRSTGLVGDDELDRMPKISD